MPEGAGLRHLPRGLCPATPACVSRRYCCLIMSPPLQAGDQAGGLALKNHLLLTPSHVHPRTSASESQALATNRNQKGEGPAGPDHSGPR